MFFFLCTVKPVYTQREIKCLFYMLQCHLSNNIPMKRLSKHSNLCRLHFSAWVLLLQKSSMLFQIFSVCVCVCGGAYMYVDVHRISVYCFTFIWLLIGWHSQNTSICPRNCLGLYGHCVKFYQYLTMLSTWVSCQLSFNFGTGWVLSLHSCGWVYLHTYSYTYWLLCTSVDIE